MMQAPASRASLATLRDKHAELARRFTTADGLSGLGADLYAAAGVLATQHRLRRALGDPAAAPEARTGLARTLFDGKIGASALTLLTDAAGLRWSSPWDIGDALEILGNESQLAAAESQGQLDEVEDELFRFSRTLDAEDRLTTLLDEYGVDPNRRATLVHDLLEGKARPETVALLEHAVRSTRKRSIVLALDDLLDAAATRQSRSVAKVVSAVALSDAQESRLADVLSSMYGRRISIRTSVEPAVQGGLLIRVGDEVIDGTLQARFAAARLALTGA